MDLTAKSEDPPVYTGKIEPFDRASLVELIVTRRRTDGQIPGSETAFTTAATVAGFARQIIGARVTESLLVFQLDNRYRLLGYEEIARGTLNTVSVHPADIVRGALLMGALAIILVHNHPSGDTTPSAEDRDLTRRARSACDLLGIRLLDHVVVCDGDRYDSMADQL